jgi:hypothetical protein
MAFALTPLLPFVDGSSVITAAWLNHVRLALADAVDGPGGGTYNLLPGHTLSFPAGGGDIDFAAPFRFSDGDVPVGGHLDIYGVETVRPGATLYIDGASLNPGILQLKAYSVLDALSGSLAVWHTGSVITVNGTAYLQSGATLHVGDATAGVGHIHIHGSGAAALSDLVMDAGTVCTLNGAVIITGATTLGGLTQLTMSQPGATADPGFNNALYGTNTCKAWGCITFSGAGTPTVADGYNCASAVRGGAGNTVLTVGFVRAMASPNYDVSFTPRVTDGNMYVPTLLTKSPSGFTVQVVAAIVDLSGAGAFGVVHIDNFTSFPELSFAVFARQ